MRDEKRWKGPTLTVAVEIDGSTSIPQKTNMTMEKQLFEDVSPNFKNIGDFPVACYTKLEGTTIYHSSIIHEPSL